MGTCRRCGDFACADCFRPEPELCAPCFARDPHLPRNPIPWEQAERPLAERLLATLATAARPIASASRLRGERLAPAIRFAAATSLPIGALGGIVPYTRTLLFQGALRIAPIGEPSVLEVAIDVVRAAAIGALNAGAQVATCSAGVMAWFFFGAKRAAAARVALYRAWLEPAAMTIVWLNAWLLSLENMLAIAASAWLPRGVLFVALIAGARRACASGWLRAIAAAVTAMIALSVVQGAITMLLLPGSPD